jgi:hypothetical protein
MTPFRFEDGLAKLFAFESGNSLLTLLALAERARLSQRIPDWLTRKADGSVRRKFAFDWLGPQWIKNIVPFWEVLRAGSARDIEDSVRALISPDRCGSDLEFALRNLIKPLALLERSQVAAELHDEMLNHGIQITRQTALTLAQAGDWQHVLAVLTSGHQHDPELSTSFATHELLWRHAYLDGLTETVLPRLAAIPFDRSLAHARELRGWWLTVRQIRAGNPAVRVPVIEPDQQSPGYVEAAAIQIAALAGDSSQAKVVEDLRRVLTPKTIKVDLPQRGLSFSMGRTAHELFKADVMIAAKRKDHAQAARLARLPSHDPFISAADVVIDAFLEEGDWRGAAMIAAKHDPRERPVIEGFDDERLDDYQSVQLAIAAVAARSGDDAAAQTFLRNYALSYARYSKTSPDDLDLDDLDLGGDGACRHGRGYHSSPLHRTVAASVSRLTFEAARAGAY